MQRLGFTRVGNKQGYPLAIIHGWGCDSSFLLPIARMFPDRDVYLIDLPGYGRSEHLASIAEDFSKTNYLLLNTIPCGADVISWSFGTLYALRAISTVNNPCLNFDVFEKNMVFSCNQMQELFDAQAKDQIDSFDHMSVAQAAKLAHEGIDNCAGIPKPNGLTIYNHPLIRSLVTICGSPRFPSDPNWQGMSAVKILKCNTKLTPRRLNMVLNIFFRLVDSKKKGSAKSQDKAAINVSSKTDARMSLKTAQNQTDSEKSLNKLDEKSTAAPADPAVKYSKAMCSSGDGKEIPYEVLMAGIRLVTFIDERPAMHHINIPTLHLFGALDPLVPASLSKYFDNPPLHRSYIFANSSHNPVQSEPEEFFKVVSDFYQSIEHN
ncbi:MAG: alpha/beta fold hydrolase [Anaerobiospirillum succiniciproducens]|uniref:alpha/beta fold hydrolase n=1 Tax=Anaerobiospirillum succiniciproducens TaxID=13335 RepID=UPI0026DD48C2|nr:alpha/beta fold hydrolase [Anaerobiospirillum succiniciproducens]MDO4675730.1 alpha/beta fold hydrolase [Anaerobiospirillum succiniciproducens]